MVEGAVFAVLAALLGLMCARHWGPEIAGVTALALSMSALCTMVAQLGTDQAIILRFVDARDPARLLQAVLLLRAVSTLLALAGLLASTVMYADVLGPWWLLPLLTFAQGVLSSADVLRLRAQALNTLHHQSPWRIAAGVFFFAAKLGALFHWPPTWSVWGIAVINAVEAAVLLAISLLVAQAGDRTSAHDGAAAQPWSQAVELARVSLPLFAAGFAVMVFFRLDYLALAALTDAYQLGLYASSMRLLELYLAVGNLLLLQFMPQLARSHQHSPSAYAKSLRALFGLSYLIAAGTLVFNVLLGAPLIVWALGAAYAPVADMSTLLCLLSIPLLSGTVRGFAITIQGLHAYHLYCALLGIGLGVPLLATVIPLFGFRGAIWVDVLTQVASAMLSTLMFPALRGIASAQWFPRLGWRHP